MTWDQVLSYCEVPTSIIITLFLVVVVVRWVVGGGESRLRNLANRLFGDGQRPGLLARVDAQGAVLAKHTETLEAIKDQLSPNSGSSLHDLMQQMNKQTAAMSARLDDHLASPHPKS